MSNRLISTLVIALVLVEGCSPTKDKKIVRGVLGDSAMIVTAHPLATEVGFQILKSGGNAMDAAIATQFALAVVYPRAGNIGGGGFALIRFSDGEVTALDFREKAPLAASKNMYQDSVGSVSGEKSKLGHLAAGVPGSVAGMWALHQKHGSMKWEELVQPAIDLAFIGHLITTEEAEILNEKQEEFVRANRYRPWVIRERGWKARDYVKQPQLAATLSFVRDSGRDGFYKGIVAGQIVKEMQAGKGLITYEDLEQYQPSWRKPLETFYKGNRVITMPLPSSGGVALVQLLHGAELLQLGQYAHNSLEATHLMAEIEKRVFADRAKLLGDPDFYEVPLKQLISKEYNAQRFEGITTTHITPSSEVEAGKIEVPYESDQTTHFSIVDKYGNAVALTTTLNLNYGCKVWVKGTGFVLNNEMDDFSAKPGIPNFFGLIGAEANAIAPEKRMLSSMTPTIVDQDGNLKAVLGSPGGATIITTVFQTIRNIVDYDMTMQEAVNAKKIHHQWLPDSIKMEIGALQPEIKKALELRGYQFEEVEKIGRSDCILVLPDGRLEGAADPRGNDYAAGY